jgi:hypothetical protein
MPQLAVHYASANLDVFGVRPYVHGNIYPLFSVFEDDLRELQIPPRDFAFTIVKLKKKFVIAHGWKCMPIRVFLTNHCIKRYQDIKSTSTVEIINTDKESLLYNELLVARIFVDRNVNGNKFVRFGEIVSEIEPMLSKEWLDLYVNNSKRPSSEAIDILAEEYNIRVATSYLDIVDALI